MESYLLVGFLWGIFISPLSQGNKGKFAIGLFFWVMFNGLDSSVYPRAYLLILIILDLQRLLDQVHIPKSLSGPVCFSNLISRNSKTSICKKKLFIGLIRRSSVVGHFLSQVIGAWSLLGSFLCDSRFLYNCQRLSLFLQWKPKKIKNTGIFVALRNQRAELLWQEGG